MTEPCSVCRNAASRGCRYRYYFFARLTVQEPTFSEVAVVYSEIIPDEPPQAQHGMAWHGI